MEILEKNFFSRSLFIQKVPSDMFDSVLNTPLELLTIFAKSSILDVQLRSEYADGTVNYFCKRLRSSHRRSSVRKGVLRNFAKFTAKHLCQSLFFNKLQAWHWCFPVNFAKFLRTPFQEITLDDCFGRLYLKMFEWVLDRPLKF